MLKPLDSWGPALLHHRKLAARTHEEHGTDFGGEIYYFQKRKGAFTPGDGKKDGRPSDTTPAEVAELNVIKEDDIIEEEEEEEEQENQEMEKNPAEVDATSE